MDSVSGSCHRPFTADQDDIPNSFSKNPPVMMPSSAVLFDEVPPSGLARFRKKLRNLWRPHGTPLSPLHPTCAPYHIFRIPGRRSGYCVGLGRPGSFVGWITMSTLAQVTKGPARLSNSSSTTRPLRPLSPPLLSPTLLYILLG